MTREYVLSAHVDSIRDARAHVRDTLGAYTDADTLDRLELVVSELVTNSVLHGPPEPITLRLATDGSGGFAGEVEDGGAGDIELRTPGLSEAVGGLGLVIVDELTSAWGIYPSGSHVWFRFEAA